MIPLYLQKDTAYVWNSEDWYTLRSQHRICGALIGSIASHPRQNDFLGLPMALMPEEVRLLVEKEICELVEIPQIIEEPSDAMKTEALELETKLIEEQKEALKKKKIEQLSQKIDIILAGKRKKLLSKGLSDENLDKNALLQEEINKCQPLAPGHVLVHLPVEYPSQSETQQATVDRLVPSIVDAQGSARYSIFKDLWEKGYHITEGLKFGADYLVYPGDPVKFHAMYMIRCYEHSLIPLRPTELVAFGRLSVSVNKLAVLAYKDCLGDIIYQTLQWHESVNGDPVKFHAMYMIRCYEHSLIPLRPTELVAFGRLSVSVNKLAVLAYKDCLGDIIYQTLQWHESVNG